MSEPRSRGGVPGRLVLIVMAITAAVIAASAIIVWLLGAARRTPEPPVPAQIGSIESGSFREEGLGRAERRRAGEILEGFGWIDRDAGVVYIPIEAAFDRYLEEAR